MSNILCVMGTRPEVIKMAPVVMALRESSRFTPIVCTTSQHREMQNAMMDVFGLKADYDLDCMQPNQDLFHITHTILTRIKPVLQAAKPDLVLVQGDTTTSFAACLAAFYLGIPVGHIEAGLRTHDLSAPFPEEANRALIGRLASYHFAPTQTARQHLLEERIADRDIYVTGNTVIDALLWVKQQIREQDVRSVFSEEIWNIILRQPFVLITGHRRESFGDGFESICQAIRMLSKQYPYYHFIYPVHLNPNVQGPVNRVLANIPNVHLIPPLEYKPFVFVMDHCKMVLSDSGGVQEEAPSLAKPVLVMREKTERTEGIEAGTAKLVGTSMTSIVEAVSQLITDANEYEAMAKAVNPYGDGIAAKRIVEILSASMV